MSTTNGDIRHRNQNGTASKKANGVMNEHLNGTVVNRRDATSPSGREDLPSSANTFNLLICVGGIYASFLTWGVLQERITTTDYGTPLKREVFHYPVVMNTVQSAFAALLGYIYVL
ncbi:UDP-galactose transporter, partial [Teratosphaeriaceae sp. CCFEE 6253]